MSTRPLSTDDIIILTVAALTMSLGVACSTSPEPGGCVKDTDCKGDRLCIDGVCSTPDEDDITNEFSEAGEDVSHDGTVAMNDACRDGAAEYATLNQTLPAIPLQIWIQKVGGTSVLKPEEVEADIEFANTFFRIPDFRSPLLISEPSKASASSKQRL